MARSDSFLIDYDAPDELILQHSQIRARPAVPKKDIRSLDNWFWNNDNAILPEETDYIKHPSDLFSLVPRQKSPLRLLLERSSHFRFLRLWQHNPVDHRAGEDKNVHYFSDEKIDRFVATVIMISGLIMLVAPLWILAFLQGLSQRLGVISAFIILFVALLSSTTVAKTFESLAAAAAYVLDSDISLLLNIPLLMFMQICGSASGLSADIWHKLRISNGFATYESALCRLTRMDDLLMLPFEQRHTQARRKKYVYSNKPQYPMKNMPQR